MVARDAMRAEIQTFTMAVDFTLGCSTMIGHSSIGTVSVACPAMFDEFGVLIVSRDYDSVVR